MSRPWTLRQVFTLEEFQVESLVLISGLVLVTARYFYILEASEKQTIPR
jgi:hypothetical protein